ncbi:MAG: hypothetical protein AAF752_10435 [Bacteroidota bacterium]
MNHFRTPLLKRLIAVLLLAGSTPMLAPPGWLVDEAVGHSPADWIRAHFGSDTSALVEAAIAEAQDAGEETVDAFVTAFLEALPIGMREPAKLSLSQPSVLQARLYALVTQSALLQALRSESRTATATGSAAPHLRAVSRSLLTAYPRQATTLLGELTVVPSLLLRTLSAAQPLGP